MADKKYQGRGKFGEPLLGRFERENEWEDFGASSEDEARPENSGYAEVREFDTLREVK